MIRDKLLIIDDENDMLEGIKRVLAYEMKEWTVNTCCDPVKAIDMVFENSPDLVLLDVRMPGMDGLEVLKRLKQSDPLLTCIMMTAHGTIELAVDAMKAGAYDFITKPFEKETLLRTLSKGLERNRLIRENRFLRARIGNSDFHGMIGRSPAMRHLFDRIKAVARSEYSVLIRGKSGTGKELTARAIHAESRRNKFDLIIVNCPAIPEHLLESELFGHRRGAFTGADRDQRGLFEEADGGNLFLDEIGDIPISVQTKLLRALQDGEIKPLGKAQSIKVDVRIIAATNQNLEEKIENRSFREDLFYRLNVVSLRTPDLKQNKEDIPVLVKHFNEIACQELEITNRRFTPEALKLLIKHNWPGNVRQLQNTVRQAVIFASSEILTKEEIAVLLSDTNRPSGSVTVFDNSFQNHIEPYKKAKEYAIENFTTKYLENLLSKTKGNVSRSAELSGIGRPSLQKILRRFHIDAKKYRTHPD